MLGRLFAYAKTRRALKILEAHPVYGVALTAIRDGLAEGSPGVGKAPRQFREDLANRLIREVGEVLSAPDPVMANREKLASYVLEMAKFQVLILPSPSESELDVTRLRGRPGITGELKDHLNEIAEKDKAIKELAWSLDTAAGDTLYDACLFSYRITGFMANVFHVIRVALGDYHLAPEKDWYRPFVEAMCAWEESNLRKAIGLPDVLATQDQYGELAALRYSTFCNVVLSGARYPNLEWADIYRREGQLPPGGASQS